MTHHQSKPDQKTDRICDLICEKWVLKLGPAFNPITMPPLDASEAEDYRGDMRKLCNLTLNPIGHAASVLRALYPEQCFHFCFANVHD